MKHILLKEIAPLGRVAFENWINDRAPRMGAALAYYIALSLAQTLLILLAIAGLAFGAQAAECRLTLRFEARWIRRSQGNSGQDRERLGSCWPQLVKCIAFNDHNRVSGFFIHWSRLTFCNDQPSGR